MTDILQTLFPSPHFPVTLRRRGHDHHILSHLLYEEIVTIAAVAVAMVVSGSDGSTCISRNQDSNRNGGSGSAFSTWSDIRITSTSDSNNIYQCLYILVVIINVIIVSLSVLRLSLLLSLSSLS